MGSCKELEGNNTIVFRTFADFHYNKVEQRQKLEARLCDISCTDQWTCTELERFLLGVFTDIYRNSRRTTVSNMVKSSFLST